MGLTASTATALVCHVVDHVVCGYGYGGCGAGSCACPDRGSVHPLRAAGAGAGVRVWAGRGFGAEERLDAGRAGR
jgi:hypothetical protein